MSHFQFPVDLKQWLRQQARQDLLHIIVGGGGGAGKGTLADSLCRAAPLMGALPDLNNTAIHGKDRLNAMNRCFLLLSRRRCLIDGATGYEGRIGDFVVAASTADMGMLLIDASMRMPAAIAEARQHAFLFSLVGIQQVIFAINKMDRVAYRQTVFEEISQGCATLTTEFDFQKSTVIPISARKGDNLFIRSPRTAWYRGDTLMDCLSASDAGQAMVDKATTRKTPRLIFSVQWIHSAYPDQRGLAGTVASGQVAVGDIIRVAASGRTATVASLISANGRPCRFAATGAVVTIVLDQAVGTMSGDVISHAAQPLEMTDQFEATVVWLGNALGLTGRAYKLKLANQWVNASITAIKYRVVPDDQTHLPCRQLAHDHIVVCNLALDKSVVFDAYANEKVLGGFILADKLTYATVALGMIRHNLRRAQNVHRHALSITREDRERLNGHRGKVIWFTGLSGSGKSTIANSLEKELHAQGKRTYILDGDNIRQGLNKDLGFTDADRVENIRRVAEIAKLMMDAGLIVMTAFISPFRAEREMARQLIGEGNFIEVFVDTPLEICEQRDPKGLYKKARNGQLPNMTGVSSPYERPEHPEVTFRSESSIQDIMPFI